MAKAPMTKIRASAPAPGLTRTARPNSTERAAGDQQPFVVDLLAQLNRADDLQHARDDCPNRDKDQENERGDAGPQKVSGPAAMPARPTIASHQRGAAQRHL